MAGGSADAGDVEDVFWRCVEVRKDRGRLRGQVMAVAAAMAGEP